MFIFKKSDNKAEISFGETSSSLKFMNKVGNVGCDSIHNSMTCLSFWNSDKSRIDRVFSDIFLDRKDFLVDSRSAKSSSI